MEQRWPFSCPSAIALSIPNPPAQCEPFCHRVLKKQRKSPQVGFTMSPLPLQHRAANLAARGGVRPERLRQPLGAGAEQLPHLRRAAQGCAGPQWGPLSQTCTVVRLASNPSPVPPPFWSIFRPSIPPPGGREPNPSCGTIWFGFGFFVDILLCLTFQSGTVSQLVHTSRRTQPLPPQQAVL